LQPHAQAQARTRGALPAERAAGARRCLTCALRVCGARVQRAVGRAGRRGCGRLA
jgi:hypothetical protein